MKITINGKKFLIKGITNNPEFNDTTYAGNYRESVYTGCNTIVFDLIPEPSPEISLVAIDKDSPIPPSARISRIVVEMITIDASSDQFLGSKEFKID